MFALPLPLVLLPTIALVDWLRANDAAEGAALDADVRRRPARDALVRVADQIPASEERGQYDATCVSERERAARRGEAMRERVSGRREAGRCKREGDATTFVSERRRRERAAQGGGAIAALLVTTRVAG